jgi:hypothetical protein
MPHFYFDVRDHEGLTSDDTGQDFSTLEEVSEYALSVLPDLARDERLSGAGSAFLIRVRNSCDENIFRASLVLSSAWLVDESDGLAQPGGDRFGTAITKLVNEFRSIRRDIMDDGLTGSIAEIDSLIGIVQSELEGLRSRTSKRWGIQT